MNTQTAQNLPQISDIDVYAARSLIVMSCVLALICSAWTIDSYVQGSNVMLAYAWIGTAASAALVVGLFVEGVHYYLKQRFQENEKFEAQHENENDTTVAGRLQRLQKGASNLAEQARQSGVGVSIVHIATVTITIFAICVAAVNVHSNVSSGLYAISCAVIAYVWIYNVLFVPKTAVHIAVFSTLTKAEKNVLAAQQHAIQLVWRNSTITP